MKNISSNGEPINLEIGTIYFVIDTLYLEDIKEEIHNLNEENFSYYIRNQIFPYLNTPYVYYKACDSLFKVDQIKKFTGDEEQVNNSVFATDTGLIIFINQHILLDVLRKHPYNFGDLVDTNSVYEFINMDYWNLLTHNYKYTDFALIANPGLDSGFDFVGSGIYEIGT